MQDPERNTPTDGAAAGAGKEGEVGPSPAGDPRPPESLVEPASPGPGRLVSKPAESAPPVVETLDAARDASRDEVSTRTPSRPSRPAPFGDAPSTTRAARGWKALSPIARAALAIAGGAALLGAALAPLFLRSGGIQNRPVPATAAAIGASLAATESIAEVGTPNSTDAGTEATAPRAPLWRVGQLADDSDIKIVEAVIGRKSLLAVLAGAHVSRGEAQRVANSLAAVRSVDHLTQKDSLTVALDKATDRVVAFELVSSPLDVWQGREVPQPSGGPKLETSKLEFVGDRVRVARAVVVGADLRTSFVDAGLAPVDEVLSMLDDALEGHAELSDIRPGARLRFVGTQEQIDGAVVRWVSLEAVEYIPAATNAPPVRVYSFEGEEGEDSHKHHGWYDSKGRQPYHGGFRSPVPLARIASRFNPHRMHPVLHVVMPHNGVDFAAPVGAPVYATAAGVVTSVGREGPCGNKVEIAHAGGVTSVYCHLSRFAQGLHAGMHVEQRQLIAYVGQTGRVTGPHLHFGIRRGGVFVDPMSLRLDGVRVVPRGLRDEFDKRRVELDTALDQIALPAAGPVAAEPAPAEAETFYEEP